MSTDHSKEFDDSASPLSNDESTPFQGTRMKSVHTKSTKILAIIITLGYLALGGMYIRIHIQYSSLESEVRNLRPELFPCESC
jgi:hypothetical protein